MNVRRWMIRQYTRLDLTRLKAQGLISIAGSVSMVLTAWVLGGSVLLILALGTAFLLLGFTGYALDKREFHKDQYLEQFKQLHAMLFVKQWEWITNKVATKMRMSEEDLADDLARWARELGFE